VDTVPDPLLLRKFGSAGKRTRTSGSAAKYFDHSTTEAALSLLKKKMKTVLYRNTDGATMKTVVLPKQTTEPAYLVAPVLFYETGKLDRTGQKRKAVRGKRGKAQNTREGQL
jgi:hypothetical protein